MCWPIGRQLRELGSEKDVRGRERLYRHEWAARGGHESGPWGCGPHPQAQGRQDLRKKSGASNVSLLSCEKPEALPRPGECGAGPDTRQTGF